MFERRVLFIRRLCDLCLCSRILFTCGFILIYMHFHLNTSLEDKQHIVLWALYISQRPKILNHRQNTIERNAIYM